MINQIPKMISMGAETPFKKLNFGCFMEINFLYRILPVAGLARAVYSNPLHQFNAHFLFPFQKSALHHLFPCRFHQPDVKTEVVHGGHHRRQYLFGNKQVP